MAVRTALTRRSAFEEDSKLDLTPTDEPVESLGGWCGGDFTEDVLDPVNVKVLKEEIRFKNTLIDELQKSNHELRLKFAEAENKLAKMRAKIDSHCDCCRGMDDDKRRYTVNDWSSTHSFGLDVTQFWNKEVVKVSDDNPYVKVQRWQDTFAKGELKETESTSSGFVKRSPNCLSARSGTRPESPATSALTGEYLLVPPGASTPSGQRSFEADESRPGSPQRLSVFTQEQIAYGDDIDTPSFLPIKCSPDQRVQRYVSPVPSRVSARDSVENHLDKYRRAAQQTMQNVWTEHENFRRLTTWRRPDVNGIVGQLLRDPDHKNHRDLKNTS